MSERITPELKKKITAQVQKMISEDLAAGRKVSENAKNTYFENVTTYELGISPEPNEYFWKDNNVTKNNIIEPGLKAINVLEREKAATEYDPSTLKKLSFSDVVSPFYGKDFNNQVQQARNYIKTNLSQPITEGPVRFANFDRFLDPNRINQKIPVYTAINPDESSPARANYDQESDRIIMGESFKYGTGKPVEIQMNNKKVVLPASSSYQNVLNHEFGHSMFPAGKGLYLDKASIAYYDSPIEMITELAHAQRQYYKNTGKRFNETSFVDFMNRAKNNNKLLDMFAPNTQNALKNLLDGSSDEVETRVKQAAKAIPGLVKNEKAIGIINALKA